MKKLPINARVHVDGQANQWPYERVVDTGRILSYAKPNLYLVRLDQNREYLLFRRSDLTIIPEKV